jgi:hypothetical protein
MWHNIGSLKKGGEKMFFFSKIIDEFVMYLQRRKDIARYKEEGKAVYKEVRDALYASDFVLDKLFWKANAGNGQKKEAEGQIVYVLEKLRKSLYKKEDMWGPQVNQKVWIAVPRMRIFLIKMRLTRLREKGKGMERVDKITREIEKYITVASRRQKYYKHKPAQ